MPTITESRIAEITEAIRRLRQSGQVEPHHKLDMFRLQLELVGQLRELIPAETQQAFSHAMWDELDNVLATFGEVARRMRVCGAPMSVQHQRGGLAVRPSFRSRRRF